MSSRYGSKKEWYAVSESRPLVGPGNTSHALDGPRRRSCSAQRFIIDIENTPAQRIALHSRRMQTATKKPQGDFGLGVRLFLHFDVACEPYGRRLASAPSNNKADRFRSDVIPLLYLAKRSRSSTDRGAMWPKKGNVWRKTAGNTLPWGGLNLEPHCTKLKMPRRQRRKDHPATNPPILGRRDSVLTLPTP